MSHPWLVPVTALRRSVGQRREEHRAGPLGSLVVAGSQVRANAAVAVDVLLTSVSGGIEVSGTVTAPWEGECRRCLQPVTDEVVVEVRELYRPVDRTDRQEEDEETYELVGDQLDLGVLARDAVLLELPLAPMCRPDCAGLCPTCGADLNLGPCDCDAGDVDPRWAALDALRSPGGGAAAGEGEGAAAGGGGAAGG